MCEGTITVETVSLDAFARGREVLPIGILKIDVEGAELEVLRGANEILPATRQIIVECHSKALRVDVEEFLACRRFIRTGEHEAAGCWILGFRHPEASLPRREVIH